MKSQTVRRPENKRSARSTKSRRYNKQTAHVEARRDGKPLIFGWGGHLSHSEKTRLQRRATWVTAISIALLIVLVLVGYWVNINVIAPSLPITTVNGHPIPQSQYRKLVAVKAQLELNLIYGPHGLFAQRDSLSKQINDQGKVVSSLTTQVDNLNKQIKALPAGPSAKRTKLNTQLKAAQKQLTDAQTKQYNLGQQLQGLTQNSIPQETANFNQSQIGTDSATWLQDDELIREWLATQTGSIQSKINPSASALSRALNDFKASIPISGPHASSYSKFLKQDNLSDDDVQTMLALKLRREIMQTYLSSLMVSPTYQVLFRTMTLSTMSQAQSILKQLMHGGNFAKLAKANSVDASTSGSGGYMDWQSRGQYAYSEQSAVVENWLFDPSRKLNEISPVLTENGAYHIVQILNIDPARPVDKSQLQSLKTNALSNWLLTRRALPGANITPVDQNKLLDPMNLPPDLPAGAPSGQPGAPGSQPGVPGGP